MATIPATTNHVTNPWFAINTTGWTVGDGTIARSTTRSLQGPASGLVTANGGTVNVRANINATLTAAPYTQSAWIWHDLGAGRNFQLIYNSGAISTDTVLPAGQWAQLAGTFTGQASLFGFQVRLLSPAAGETFFIGYFGIEPGSVATAPCPAIDATGAILPGHAWTGTPHASISTRSARYDPDATLRIGSPHIGPLRVGRN